MADAGESGRRAAPLSLMVVDEGRIQKALPGYRVGQRLGSGQFGLVMEGRDRRLRRPVAIKVMEGEGPEGMTVDFAAEARILAGFDHPHIVRIYEYVEAEGLCLVVMELLAGGTLTRRRDGLDQRQACAVGVAVATALEHAHSRGVLHRDIKSDNILFAADGTMKVTDFGISRLFDGSGATASSISGTPLYMAPEQIDGRRLGPTTDLYALGVVLYQLLAGVPPFDPRQPVQMLWQQHLADAPPPLHGKVPEPIAAVVLRALAKNPDDRQPDAATFAADLAQAATDVHGPGWSTPTGLPLHLAADIRRLHDLPAPPPVPAPATGRPAHPRRRRTAAAAAAAATLAVLGGLVAWQTSLNDPRLQPSTVDAQGLSRTLAAAANTAIAPHPELARRLAVAAYRTAPTPQARAAVLRLLATSQPLATIPGAASGAQFSPDGRLLASSSGDEGNEDEDDGNIRLWDTASLRGSNVRPVATITDPPAWAAQFSPDGTLLVTSTSGDHPVQVWDTTALLGDPAPQPVADLPVPEVVFSPDGTLLATGAGDRGVQLWDTAAVRAGAGGTNGQPLATLTTAGSSIGYLTFGRGGTVVATTRGNSVLVWDTAARGRDVPPVATFTVPVPVSSLDLRTSPDGTLLTTTGDDDGDLGRVWDTASLDSPNSQPLATLPGLAEDGPFSPDGKLLVTTNDYVTQLWMADPDRLTDTACAAEADELTEAEWKAVLPAAPYQAPCS